MRLLVLAFCCFVSCSLAAGESEAGSRNSVIEEKIVAHKDRNQAEKGEKGAEKSPEERFESQEEVLKDYQKSPGFLNVYQKDNDLVLEVDRQFLDQEFFMFSAMSRGTLDYIMPNWMLTEQVLYFKLIGKEMVLFQKQTTNIAEKDSPAESAVRKAWLDSLVYKFEVVAASKGEKSYFISLSDFLFFQGSKILPSWMLDHLGFSGVSANNSFLTAVKSFPRNLEVEVQTTLQSSDPAYGKSNQIRLNYSFMRKDKSDYVPRIADERIGYFTADFKDRSNPGIDEGNKRLIYRWNLQKADPKAEVSVVRQPIIFHLDETIPFEYRQYVRAGVLEWNKAFEKIGFLGAVEARLPEQGQAWDPSDARYSTISWAANDDGLAIGPSRANPQTGEILDADVILSAGWIDHINKLADVFGSQKKSDEGFVDDSTSAFRRLLAKHGKFAGDDFRFKAAGIQLATMNQKAGVENIEAMKVWREKFIGDYLKELTMHEVGHVLGLRHNFKASSIVEMGKIRDPKWSLENPLSSSVMDYNDVYIAPDPKNQGSYIMTTLGEYDYLAIEYGYKALPPKKDEAPELNKIAQSLRQKNLEYGSDEDEGGIDPHALTYDIGNDLVESAKDRISVIQRLLPSLDAQILTTGERYSDLRQALGFVFSQWGRKSLQTIGYIGGVHVTRDRVNDPGAKSPMIPVTYEMQIKALDYLQDYVFREGVLTVPPLILQKARTNPWEWEEVGINELDAYQARIRRIAIQHLIQPDLFKRMEEFQEKLGIRTLKAIDLVDRITGMVFRELPELVRNQGKEPYLGPLSMETQKYYVTRLGEIVLGEREATNSSRLYALSNLNRIRSDLEAGMKALGSVKTGNPVLVSLHYKDLSQLIQKVLSADLVSTSLR